MRTAPLLLLIPVVILAVTATISSAQSNPVITYGLFGIIQPPAPPATPAACLWASSGPLGNAGDPLGCWEGGDSGLDYGTPGSIVASAYDLSSPVPFITYCGIYWDACDSNNPNYLVELACGSSIDPQYSGYGGYAIVDCSLLAPGGICYQPLLGGAFCTQPLPDLRFIPGFWTYSAASQLVTVTIANTGIVAAPQSTSQAVVQSASTGATVSNNIIPTSSLPAFAGPGSLWPTTTISFSVAGLNPGLYNVKISADWNNQIAETNERNNFLSFPLLV